MNVSGNLDLQRKQLLKPGAVRTIFPKPASSSDTSIRPKWMSAAFKKREHSRVCIFCNTSECMTSVVVENEEMEEAVPISSNTEKETSSRETPN